VLWKFCWYRNDNKVIYQMANAYFTTSVHFLISNPFVVRPQVHRWGECTCPHGDVLLYRDSMYKTLEILCTKRMLIIQGPP